MFALPGILAPVDFSERCPTACRYARALACHFHSELTLLHVMPVSPVPYAGLEFNSIGFADLMASTEPFLRSELEHLLPGEFRSGDPAQEIVAYARESGASLIVMPTDGYGPFRRFVLGSVTGKVLHDADCPVFTAVHMPEQPDLESLSFRRIVCAVDLGPQSARTLQWASRFADESRAALTIVHIMPCLESRGAEYFDPRWREYEASVAREDVETLQKRAGTGAEVEVDGAKDIPGAVCGAADSFGADLLVIGRSAQAGIFGRLRTNAYAIIRESPCPVVSV